MNRKAQITGFVSIKDNRIYRNGSLFFEAEQNFPFGEFTKTTFKSLGINYMKFYKMDNLCKIAFLSAEILLKDAGLNDRYKPEDIGIVFINSASSLDTDIRYQETFNNKSSYFPNPSLFVYTLPNIMIGEISIKNNFKGENALFLFNNFENRFLTDYIIGLLNNGKIKACVGGYIDYDPALISGKSTDSYESFVFLAETFAGKETDLKFTLNSDNINNLYQTGRI